MRVTVEAREDESEDRAILRLVPRQVVDGMLLRMAGDASMRTSRLVTHLQPRELGMSRGIAPGRKTNNWAAVLMADAPRSLV